jgi:hypothetical protein
MSNAFGGGSRKPKIQQAQKIENIEQVREDETASAQREKRKQVLTGGRQSTIISGIRQALKQRLGE